MDELQIVRGMLLRAGGDVRASSPVAKTIMVWASPHHSWLGIEDGARDRWEALLRAARRDAPANEPLPAALDIARRLAAALAFDDFDTRFLILAVASVRLSRVSDLLEAVTGEGVSLPALLGELAGAESHDAARRVGRSAAVRLGLISFWSRRINAVSVQLGDALERLLDRGFDDDDDLVELLIGGRQTARLMLDDFSQREAIGFMVRLLRGATRDKAAGINILIHGPPGVGKTELARTLAAEAGATLYGVGEADDDGDEPERHERVQSLRLAQRLLGRASDAILLFDEMEDLIGDARPSPGDWMAARSGSKVFVNRLLETNTVPVIWTTNAIGNIDKAILRRMSFVLKMGLPSRAQGRRMLMRVAAEEAVTPGPALQQLLDAAPETTTILRVAMHAAKLAGDDDGGVLPATALVRAMGGEVTTVHDEPLDLDLYESDPPIAPLLRRIVEANVLDISLLLTGPPGTGKSALAHHLARLLDLPLLVKRASDLLSPWVGGTEAAIADAFVEARQRHAVLLFDEVDSLLFDRLTAQTHWEVGQVNELLTWLDRHPLPVIAATNHAHKLDPAALRRFVFKLDLRPLGKARAARAFDAFFGLPAPTALAELRELTPGDFAVVKRQMRYRPECTADTIVEALRMEVDAKPEKAGRIGFQFEGGRTAASRGFTLTSSTGRS